MSQKKLISLITGATGKIGAEIARQLVASGKYDVTITARDRKKGEDTVAQIKSSTKSQDVKFVLVDTSVHTSIIEIAKQWNGPLNLLINIASETPKKREVTEAGIERQFATNVLGYYWMMTEFEPYLAQGAPSRIVNVASYWAGDLDLSDLQFERRSYNNDTAYRQSKQCERMLTSHFAEKLLPKKISVNSCHPADVRSTLSCNLGYGGHETPAQGAETPVYVATSKELESVTGAYFEKMRKKTCQFSSKKNEIAKLVEICSKF